MKRSTITSLLAPSVMFLLISAIVISGHAGAQTASRLALGNAHCENPVLSHNHKLGFIGFAAGPRGLNTTVSAAPFPGASPLFSSLQATQGALVQGSTHVMAETSETGFEALYSYASMTELLDYYYNTLVGLGYTAQMKAFDRDGIVYIFTNGVSQYEVVFTFDDISNDIKVGFTPVATLVASR